MGHTLGTLAIVISNGKEPLRFNSGAMKVLNRSVCRRHRTSNSVMLSILLGLFPGHWFINVFNIDKVPFQAFVSIDALFQLWIITNVMFKALANNNAL
jgi:hypothetical protein